jgi:enoyl-CoA hydratase/carnithine racemase
MPLPGTNAAHMPALVVTRGATERKVTFANPPTNLVDPEMILELQALVDELEHDPDVTVVVFDSDIAGHFLGPYDLTRAAETPSEPGPTGMPPWLDLTVRLSRLPAVSIAVIRGASRGVGQEFALACDLRFASLEHAAIDQPEVGARLVPGGGAISRLPALVGRARALELILGSVVLDGATAERYGVVNRALPDEELDGFVEALVAQLAGIDRRVLAEAKALVDPATLPTDAELVRAYAAFFDSAARLVAA